MLLVGGALCTPQAGAACASPVGEQASGVICADCPDGTSCDNGDTCLGDTCQGGVCGNPRACDNTQFVTHGKRIVMRWHKNPADRRVLEPHGRSERLSGGCAGA